MSSSRNLTLSLLALLALPSSACEIVADFDRDRITEANAKPPSDIPMIPMVPAEIPDTLDAGDDASLPDEDAGADAGGGMDSGFAEDAGHDAAAEDDAGGDGGEDGSVDAAGYDASADEDAGV